MLSCMDDYEYDGKERDARQFEERMSLASFKGKSVEYLIRAETAAGYEVGLHYAQIAQAYATLELARVTGIQRRSS